MFHPKTAFFIALSLAILLTPSSLETRERETALEGVSIVDWLTRQGRAVSKTARGKLWDYHFPSEHGQFTGAPVQNVRLLEALMFEQARQTPSSDTCRIDNKLVVPEGYHAYEPYGRGLDLGPHYGSLDLRPQDQRNAQPNVRFFVVFSARDVRMGTRGVSPGHAWVSFAIGDSEQCHARTFGMFAEGKPVGPVDGKIVESWVKNARGGLYPSIETHRFVVRVTARQYLAARRVADDWVRNTPEYRVFRKNCVTFVADVARALGLRVGSGTWTTPESLIENLIRTNTRHQSGTKPATKNKAASTECEVCRSLWLSSPTRQRHSRRSEGISYGSSSKRTIRYPAAYRANEGVVYDPPITRRGGGSEAAGYAPPITRRIPAPRGSVDRGSVTVSPRSVPR